jgi:FkbM family methyltransferase
VSEEALRSRLERILESDLSEILRSQARRLDEHIASVGESYVLFGAGRLGKVALAGLREAGIEPVAFADNNAELRNRSVHGVRVLSPRDAAARFSSNAVFVVTVYTSQPVWEQLRALGVQAIPFALLAWKYPAALLPHGDLELPDAIFAQAAEVRKGLSGWADDASRREYLGQLEWHTSLDRSVLPAHLPQREIYFPDDIVEQSSKETFVDCGAFDGDTIREFLKRRGSSFGQVIAIEPDPTNFQALRKYVATLPEDVRSRVLTIQSAVGLRKGKVKFTAAGSAASSVGEGPLEVECAPLDELLADCSPTYIKMDIEGAELDAVAGARKVIERDAPILAICLYHKLEHLWRIPLLIRSYSSSHKLFLRRYADECWELVCYAVPTSRLRG